MLQYGYIIYRDILVLASNMTVISLLHLYEHSWWHIGPETFSDSSDL